VAPVPFTRRLIREFGIGDSILWMVAVVPTFAVATRKTGSKSALPTLASRLGSANVQARVSCRAGRCGDSANSSSVRGRPWKPAARLAGHCSASHRWSSGHLLAWWTDKIAADDRSKDSNTTLQNEDERKEILQ
jgi:hypothetical protein